MSNRAAHPPALSEVRISRRQFVKSTAAVAGLTALSADRVLGANERVGVGIIGFGLIGRIHTRSFMTHRDVDIVAIADTYGPRREEGVALAGSRAKPYSDFRRLLEDKNVEAIVVATPDHWHARMALETMAAGKDVYLEKPMCHTIDEARRLVAGVRDSKRILQVGSQTTSADQWYKAKKAIAEGMIGKMIMSQGSYHRNSTEGEWNWKIDPDAGPNGKGDNYLDWKTWLGPASKRNWDPDRYFRFRKYWDYSGGIATDLFYHVVAPLNICWGEPQFPYKVTAGGNKYIFTNDREVPDTFHLIGEYSKGHSIVLSSSMANSQHIPGLIRGHEGSIIMVEHGEFERPTEFITVRPEKSVISDAYRAKFGAEEIKIPVDKMDMMEAHVKNFLECVRSRQQPIAPIEAGYAHSVAVLMADEATIQEIAAAILNLHRATAA